MDSYNETYKDRNGISLQTGDRVRFEVPYDANRRYETSKEYDTGIVVYLSFQPTPFATNPIDFVPTCRILDRGHKFLWIACSEVERINNEA